MSLHFHLVWDFSKCKKKAPSMPFAYWSILCGSISRPTPPSRFLDTRGVDCLTQSSRRACTTIWLSSRMFYPSTSTIFHSTSRRILPEEHATTYQAVRLSTSSWAIRRCTPSIVMQPPVGGQGTRWDEATILRSTSCVYKPTSVLHSSSDMIDRFKPVLRCKCRSMVSGGYRIARYKLSRSSRTWMEDSTCRRSRTMLVSSEMVSEVFVTWCSREMKRGKYRSAYAMWRWCNITQRCSVEMKKAACNNKCLFYLWRVKRRNKIDLCIRILHNDPARSLLQMHGSCCEKIPIGNEICLPQTIWSMLHRMSAFRTTVPDERLNQARGPDWVARLFFRAFVLAQLFLISYLDYIQSCLDINDGGCLDYYLAASFFSYSPVDR